MKNLLIIFFSCFAILCQASSLKVKLYMDDTFNGYLVFVDNPYKCPISIKIKYELINLESKGGNGKIYVIPAQQKNGW